MPGQRCFTNPSPPAFYQRSCGARRAVTPRIGCGSSNGERRVSPNRVSSKLSVMGEDVKGNLRMSIRIDDVRLAAVVDEARQIVITIWREE